MIVEREINTPAELTKACKELHLPPEQALDAGVFLILRNMNVPTHIPGVIVYTDGSCNPRYRAGAWAALVFWKGEKVWLQGEALDTTHQRMELTAVIEALAFLQANQATTYPVHVITDSQYAVGLFSRKDRLKAAGFITKKKLELNNTDLIKPLIHHLDTLPVVLHKVKAHQCDLPGDNYNQEVDKHCRKLMRNLIDRIK